MENILGLDLLTHPLPSKKFLGKKSKKLNCLTSAGTQSRERDTMNEKEVLRKGMVGLSHATHHLNYSISAVTFLCRTSSSNHKLLVTQCVKHAIMLNIATIKNTLQNTSKMIFCGMVLTL